MIIVDINVYPANEPRVSIQKLNKLANSYISVLKSLANICDVRLVGNKLYYKMDNLNWRRVPKHGSSLAPRPKTVFDLVLRNYVHFETKLTEKSMN